MFTTKFLGRNGGNSERLEAQVAEQESDRALLARELGTYNPREIIAKVRDLEGKVSEATRMSAEREISVQSDDGELNQPSSPLELMNKVRSFNNRIKDLNSTVSGMEAQLLSLYEEKEAMERQIGAGDLEGILQIIQGHKATIKHMEQQLMAMYAAREVLQSEMGTSDSHHIVSLFRNVSSLVSQIQKQMATIELSSAPSAPEARAITYVDVDLPRVSAVSYDVVSEPKPAVAPRNEPIAVSATPVVTATPVATAIPSLAPLPTPVAPPASGVDAPRLNPAVAATAAAFATAAVVSAASVAAITSPTGSPAARKGRLAPDDPEYDPLSNPDDPINDDSLINGTP